MMDERILQRGYWLCFQYKVARCVNDLIECSNIRVLN